MCLVHQRKYGVWGIYNILPQAWRKLLSYSGDELDPIRLVLGIEPPDSPRRRAIALNTRPYQLIPAAGRYLLLTELVR